jgi:hypothetical protein
MEDKKTKSAVAQSRKQSAKATAKAVEDNSALQAPSAAQVASAQAEGVKEAIKEDAKDVYESLTDGNLPGEPPARQFTGMDDIMRFEPLLDLGVDEFQRRIGDDTDGGIAEEKVAGLLSLERAGRNRTPYVKAMVDRLGVDSPYEVTNAGPGYTNDVHPITEL